MTMDRQTKAVAALKYIFEPDERGEKMTNTYEGAYHCFKYHGAAIREALEAQAAIEASDVKYIKGLVEALWKIAMTTTIAWGQEQPTDEANIAIDALRQLPEGKSDAQEE